MSIDGTAVAVVGMLLAASTVEAAVADPHPIRRALVIAFNGSDVPGIAPLRFADDDGLRWAELMVRLGVEVELLTVPDVETAREQSPLLATARPPSVAEVEAAVGRIRDRNRADRQAGREADTFVVFVGHGDTDRAGGAYLNLLDGRLDRTRLLEAVIDAVDATYVHLILDACRAAGLVAGRGEADPQVLADLSAVLDRERLGARPTLGILTAATDRGETHEWSRLRAGVFSHVLRSGLAGGADVNHDGQVEYSELDSFVAAALGAVAGHGSRLNVHASAPAQNRRRPLASGVPEGPTLQVPAHGAPDRLTIEDDLGIALADLHRAAGERLRLWLPNRGGYWIRSGRREARVATAAQMSLPAMREADAQSRGPLEERLQEGLFRFAFGRNFYEGFVTRSDAVPVSFAGPAAELPAAASAAAVPASAGIASIPLDFSAHAEVASAGPVLGRPAVGFGLAAAWPSGSLAFGGRLTYSVGPRSWVGGATLHRISVEAAVSHTGAGQVAFAAEASAGWAAVLASSRAGASGDLTVPTVRAAAGFATRAWGWRLRLLAGLGADAIEVDGKRQLYLRPSLQLGTEFGARN